MTVESFLDQGVVNWLIVIQMWIQYLNIWKIQ